MVNELVNKLLDGTNFQISDQSSVLSQRLRVRTPIEAVNCLLGGGVPLGCVSQSYGPPKSGKSTWMYQTAAKFQEQYPDGIVTILDNESSADDSRLEYLGLDTSRVLRLPSSSIESGFLNLLKMLDNLSKLEASESKVMPVFAIWDTISKGLAQDNSTQSRMNAQDRARIIKNYMSPVLTKLEKHQFFLGLLNQVIYVSDKYGNTKMDAGGGVGLKHDVHFSTQVVLDPRRDEKNGPFLLGRYSNIKIDKSKLSPEMSEIPIYIDVTQGGAIDEIRSFVDYIIQLGIIEMSKGWYRIDNTLGVEYASSVYYPIVLLLWKSWRYYDLMDFIKANTICYDFLKIVFMEKIGSIYKLQKDCIQDYLDEVTLKVLTELDTYASNCSLNRDILNNDLCNISDEVKDSILNNTSEDTRVAVCLDCGAIHTYLDKACPKCGSIKMVPSDLLREDMFVVPECETAVSEESQSEHEEINEE